MSRKSRVPLSARLRRSRALSVCLGERRFFVHPLDLPCGRPPEIVSSFLRLWEKPYKAEIPFSLVECLDTGPSGFVKCSDWEFGQVEKLIINDCCSFLHALGKASGWFGVEERASLLGTSAFIHVRSFDLLATSCDLFDNRLDGGTWASDGSGQLCKRRSVPFVKGA